MNGLKYDVFADCGDDSLMLIKTRTRGPRRGTMYCTPDTTAEYLYDLDEADAIEAVKYFYEAAKRNVMEFEKKKRVPR